MAQLYIFHPIFSLLSSIFHRSQVEREASVSAKAHARLSMVYLEASKVRLNLEQDIGMASEQYKVLSYRDSQSLADIDAELVIEVNHPLQFEVSHPGDVTLHSNLWGDPHCLREPGRYRIHISGTYGLHLSVAIRQCD